MFSAGIFFLPGPRPYAPYDRRPNEPMAQRRYDCNALCACLFLWPFFFSRSLFLCFFSSCLYLMRGRILRGLHLRFLLTFAILLAYYISMPPRMACFLSWLLTPFSPRTISAVRYILKSYFTYSLTYNSKSARLRYLWCTPQEQRVERI